MQGFWEYDPSTNSWTQKADVGGVGRQAAVGFSIGNKGYIGIGVNSGWTSGLDDFWEYDPIANTWTQKADFAGGLRLWAVGFSINNKGYIGTGDFNICPNDFWEYDPLTDTWTQKADFAGPCRVLAVGFSMGNKGYIGTGVNLLSDTCYKDFWEYDPVINSWTQKANFGGIAREGAVGFSIGNRGYIGTGIDLINYDDTQSDFWEYNPVINAWKHRAALLPTGSLIAWGTGFSIGTKGYIGLGSWNNSFTPDFWEYTPDTSNSWCAANFSLYADTIPHTYIAINYSAGTPPLTYSWDWGDGNFSSGATPSHTYSAAGYYTICLNITDNVGCTDSFCYPSTLYRTGANASMVTVNVISPTTGVNYPVDENNSFSIYPNPTYGTIQLTINTKHNAPLECEIINIMGKQVYKFQIQNSNLLTSLDVSFLAKGIYLVRVGDGVRWENKKLVAE
jgi:N-acetylneuraminic acid mutarotase